MTALQKILELVPKNSHLDIGANVLGESTILVNKKDNTDFRAEFVVRGTREESVFVVGFPQGYDEKKYVNASEFKDSSLEDLCDSVDAVLKMNKNLYETSKDELILKEKDKNTEDTRPLIAILVGEEIVAHDFVRKIKKPRTLKDWEKKLRDKSIWYQVRKFKSEEQLNTYVTAIKDVENYLSTDFYTFDIILPKFIIY